MANAVEVTKDFPASRERAVLLELLNVMKTLKQAQIDAVICGGWVPFLKELARHCQTDHSMSLDIDLLLRARARERETIDRIKDLLAAPLDYKRSNTDSFRYEKNIDGNIVQLDLLADGFGASARITHPKTKGAIARGRLRICNQLAREPGGLRLALSNPK